MKVARTSGPTSIVTAAWYALLKSSGGHPFVAHPFCTLDRVGKLFELDGRGR